jgi:CHAD domain-containing protein
MKQKEIKEVITNHIDVMNSLLHKISHEFNAEDIHHFRVEVKKLRAFLRLLTAGAKPEGPLLPENLKSLYGYVGIIRNIQLHRHHLFKYLNEKKLDKPQEYFNMLEAEEDYWKKKVQELLRENNLTEKLNEQFPVKLEKFTIKKFAEEKLNALDQQLHFLKNDSIHTIRKIMKDLLYTHDYIKNSSELPEALSGKKNLKLLAIQLGHFRDKCIQLEFLSHEYIDLLKIENEKIVLNDLKQELQDEKRILVRQLTPYLNKLTEQLITEH